MLTRDQANAFRYHGSERGHYESYFQRANHPTRPLAFWIRYTVFVPKGQPDKAEGELWAVFFDGERAEVTAAKQDVPFSACQFSTRRLHARIGPAELDGEHLKGEATHLSTRLAWNLHYHGHSDPLLLLPEALYGARLPKAKALVGTPLALFSGELFVNDRRISVDGWLGSQNHNWGEQHTDRYAWGQVAGFDQAPDAFFECATASIKLGPVYTPKLTPMVLRHDGEEYAFSSIACALAARADYGYFHWHMASSTRRASIEATFRARASDFVALCYRNPPGGDKTCLNSKIASCELVLRRPGKAQVVLSTAHRAAFEILTDDQAHGVQRLDA
jgi:hypothetical protein